MNGRTILHAGISHHRAPLALRERCAVPPDERDRARAELHRRLGPVVLLSTCGRVELYVDIAVGTAGATATEALGWLAARAKLPADELRPAFEVAEGDAAVERLLRVACGLESMLEGEDEVLGQVRRAWLDAGHAGTLSQALDAAFRVAVRTGRQARRGGGGDPWTSLADAAAARVAVAVARRDPPRVLVAGSGPMGLRAARTLREHLGDTLELALAGRTPDRVAAHAAQVGARPLRLPDLPDALAWADAAVVGLRTRTPLLGAEAVATRPPERPLTIVDLSLPRAVEPAVASLPHVRLFDVDHLARAGCDRSRWDDEGRSRVERLVADAVRQLAARAERTEALDTLTSLRMRAEGVRRAQLARTLRRLPELDAEARWAVDALTRAIVNRVLHAPTLALKEEGAEEMALQVRQVFGLE